MVFAANGEIKQTIVVTHEIAYLLNVD